MIRVWETKYRKIIRILKHAKGPINNILVIKRPLCLYPRTWVNSQASSVRRHGALLPPLKKYTNSMDENSDIKAVIMPQDFPYKSFDASYVSICTMNSQINELQQQGSFRAAEMEIERLKLDYRRSMQMIQQWKKMYENLNQICVNELLDGDQARGPPNRHSI